MIEKGISLKAFNTFGFDVTAAMFGRIDSLQTLESIWKTTLIPHSHTLILGGGSNVLFAGNYQGLVLKNEIQGRQIVADHGNEVLVTIGAGENWHATVLWAVEQGLGGIENLSLIPGTVGAAPIQNIGAYGAELEQVFVSLQAFDLSEGKLVTLSHSDCRFGYRDSIFKQEGKGRFVIVSVTMKLSRNKPVNIGYGDIAAVLDRKGISNPDYKAVSEAVIEIRSSKLPDPKEIGNSGSFFKNPGVDSVLAASIQHDNPGLKTFAAGEGRTKLPAGWLIEAAGWKGYRKGDAGVHQKQALVLVNYGSATGAEIMELAHQIQADVQQKFGVMLEMEVNLLKG